MKSENDVRSDNSNSEQFEVWKEINTYARHWETLFFNSVKNYFTVIGLSISAAGVAIALSNVLPNQRLVVALGFLALAGILSSTAFFTTKSQQRYLSGFYDRRKQIEEENPSLRLRSQVEGSRETGGLVRVGFACTGGLSVVLTILVFVELVSG